MVRVAATAVLLAGLAFVGARAGGAKLKIGDPAPVFTNLPGVDGKTHSLSEYKKDVVVLCITCNHCPIATRYEDRMIDFAKKYAGKIDFVAINVNNGAADRLDKMKIRAQEKGFIFPYLYDASQEIGRKLNASVTPEFYVFNKGKLVYWGAMDDHNDASRVSKNYLNPAVEAALNSQTPAIAKTMPRGCTVQYEK